MSRITRSDLSDSVGIQDFQARAHRHRPRGAVRYYVKCNLVKMKYCMEKVCHGVMDFQLKERLLLDDDIMGVEIQDGDR